MGATESSVWQLRPIGAPRDIRSLTARLEVVPFHKSYRPAPAAMALTFLATATTLILPT